jgi:hypothetical protein
MATDFLGDHRRALESSFFHLQDKQLLEEFRQHLQNQELKAQLTEASGIHDEAVLARLVQLNIRPETLAALSLVPLVEVAWADGTMPAKTREAVMNAAEAVGIQVEDDAHQLLAAWLRQKPDDALLEAWGHYVQALCKQLDDAAAERLKRDLLDRARAVAAATGGFLGIGRINAAEKAVLDKLDRVAETKQL